MYPQFFCHGPLGSNWNKSGALDMNLRHLTFLPLCFIHLSSYSCFGAKMSAVNPGDAVMQRT